jgi:hypothetical protein
LEQLPNGNITIQQIKYVKGVKGIEISPQRKKEKDFPTTEDEKRQMLRDAHCCNKEWPSR